MEYCPHCMRPVNGPVCTSCGKDINIQNPSHLLPVGTVLAGSSEGHSYRLGAPLGQGGFGVTYIGVELESGRRVAVKEYFPTRNSTRGAGGVVDPMAGQQEAYESGRFSFLKEAHMLASLEGMSSVVQAMDYLETNNTAYLVMEFLDGTPLYRIVQEHGKVPPADLLPRFQPLMKDIGALHARNVIHRDISPDNIMWMTDGTFKLLDFGCARSTENSSSMTVALKQGFAPVEQYQSKGQGPYTDVYALAATMYYCLTGIIPPAAVERQLGGGFLQSPTSLGIPLTPDQENALLWAMTVDPKARPADMDAFSRRMFPPVTAQNAPSAPAAPAAAPGWSFPATEPVSTPPVTGGGQTPPWTAGGAAPVTGLVTGGGAVPTTGPVTRGSVSAPVAEPQQAASAAPTAPAASPAPAPAKGGLPKWVPIVAAVAAVVLIGGIAAFMLLGGGGDEVSTPPPAVVDTPEVSATPDLPVEPEDSPSPAAETRTSEDGFLYEVRDGYVAITGYEDTSESVVYVPDELDGYNVTLIGSRAFQNMTAIESVYLPERLEEIALYAFDGCSNLRDIYLYSNVKTDSSSFRGCDGLRCVVRSGSVSFSGSRLPKQCITLDHGMDTGAGNLRYVWVTDDGAVYAITTDSVAVLMDIPSDAEELTVREKFSDYPVSWIYSGAFDHADSLSYIDLPNDIACAPEIWSVFTEVTWDADDGSFFQSWIMTCILCEYMSDGRQIPLEPSIALVRASMTRSEELMTAYGHDRPDGSSWTTVFPSDYPAATVRERLYSRPLDDDNLWSVMDEIAEGTTDASDGRLFTDAGLGMYYGDQVYMTFIMSVDD